MGLCAEHLNIIVHSAEHLNIIVHSAEHPNIKVLSAEHLNVMLLAAVLPTMCSITTRQHDNIFNGRSEGQLFYE